MDHQRSTRAAAARAEVCARVLATAVGTAMFCTVSCAAVGSSGSSQAGQLLWSEEFDGGPSPQGAVWSYDHGAGGWGNRELQEYTSHAANVRVEGGHLFITAQAEALPGNLRRFTSARLKTEHKVTLQYGTVEARIKVPPLAGGLWPAFWTLGNRFGSVGWPDCGEIDVMEMGSAAAITEGLVDRRVSSAMHWERGGSHTMKGQALDSATDFSGRFVVFRLEWTPTSIATFVDGESIWAMDITPSACSDCTEFHQPHFLLLNLAVGGAFTGLYESSEIAARFPAELVVDWVRIYDNGFTVLDGSSIEPSEPGR